MFQKHINELPRDFNILVNTNLENKLQVLNIMNNLHTKGIYVSLNKPVKNLKDILHKNNIKTDDLYFIDCITRSIGSFHRIPKTEYIFNLKQLHKLEHAITTISKHIGLSEKFLILDSLPTLLNYHDKDTVLKFLRFLSSKMRDLRIKGIIINDQTLTDEFKKELNLIFDRIIQM